MNYYKLFEQENGEVEERLELYRERIRAISTENSVAEPFLGYFVKVADFIEKMYELSEIIKSEKDRDYSLEQLQKLNASLYEDIAGAAYEQSYANPSYAVEKLGEEYGAVLSFLYTEIRGMIVYAYEGRMLEFSMMAELFIEIYNLFEQEELLSLKEVKSVLYWFVSDYSDVTVTYRIREQLDPSLNFATDIITKADLNDLRYLYYYGEYITDTELKTAEFLNTLDEETVEKIASAYTEGYRIGFINGNKDLSKKKVVNIRYSVGFERIIKKAIENFEKMGLQPAIYRAAVHTVNKRKHIKIGYFSTSPNKQYDYDHRADDALYLDKAFVERKLGVLRTAYEEYKELASVHGGPACMEIFGEEPFVPENKSSALQLSEKQQKLSVQYNNAAGEITNTYIKGEERSFTIIAFPIPEIGEQFEEIFREVIKINTLDYKLYQNIQQRIIETLDKGEYVEILGKGENKTNLKVALQPVKDVTKETKFENCVADVNIPVGEVFTSPKLSGTTGLLHVTKVYLNELCYHNIEVEFKDGMIADYTCTNFEKEEDNKKYIKENVLYNHETLPMGEFAIGTNTTAYMAAAKYNINDKLPILIAEKTGPHFAVGDTCYSWSEDTKVYNPDGREIVAKDNEVSILRKEDISKAYFNCHTDITIPYDELKEIAVVTADGERISIIQDGRFVLEGCEDLNKPFDNY
ncbi:MAG: aminopeptidase [Lachnospiraceae bacterium]|nr:aminopeptidase [Lachnospiraceae bacterium]